MGQYAVRGMVTNTELSDISINVPREAIHFEFFMNKRGVFCFYVTLERETKEQACEDAKQMFGDNVWILYALPSTGVALTWDNF